MKKLKISSTIKTAWGIYRDRFGEYYRLALTNSFWIFVPVYGWAKYAAMMGLLARLAYGDVAGNVETIVEAKRHIKPKMWSFFGAGLMETLVFYGKISLILIPLRIAVAIIIRTSNFHLFLNNLFWIIIAICFFGYYYWLMSHLFLYELPLAIEKINNANKSRDTGWHLVKKSAFKLQVIIFSFSLIYALSSLVLPIIKNFINYGLTLNSITSVLAFSSSSLVIFLANTLFFCGALFIPTLSSAISILFKIAFYYFSSQNLYFLLPLFQITTFLILEVAFSALFIPFWQSLKAVTYYSLNLSPKNKKGSNLIIGKC